MNNNLYYQNNKINIITKNVNNMSNNIPCINTEEKKKYVFLKHKKHLIYNNTSLLNKNITSELKVIKLEKYIII